MEDIIEPGLYTQICLKTLVVCAYMHVSFIWSIWPFGS